MRSIIKDLFFLSMILVINSISLNKIPNTNSALKIALFQIKDATCLSGYKFKSITGIDTPIRLNRNYDVECLSIDGKNCLTKEISTDKECNNFMFKNFDNIKPLACGKMLKAVNGTEGYGVANHWCEQGKKWFFDTWHCVDETNIQTGLRIDWVTKNIECLSEDGKECLWNDLGACMRTKGNFRNCRFTKPLKCGSEYVKVHGNPDPYFSKASHWCKDANIWFFGPSEWECGGDKLKTDTPFRYNESGDIECFSVNGKECAWGYGTGKKCVDYIKDNLKNLNPLICGAMHEKIYGVDGYSKEGHWCRYLMDQYVLTSRTD